MDSCISSKKYVKSPTTKRSKDSESMLSREDKIRKKIILDARHEIGRPYKYGGKSPSGFDCSGFSYYIMNKNGISLGASSSFQSNQGIPKSLKKVEEGDLIFFGHGSKITHVGIVSKMSGKEIFMIHSSSSRGIVEDEILNSEYWNKRLKFAKDVITH